ncbi:MAG: hypothetical protein LYZ66_02450 [Nitrososphaerales archaeon]|nr:hypothetical protein [Nitrososphaerales archaeon]
MKEAESLLKEAFGLTAYEARAYIALLGRSMVAKDAAKAANVPLPRIYDTMQRLASKGFVKQSARGYAAVEPSVALETRARRFKSTFEEEQSARTGAGRKIVRKLMPLYDRKSGESEEPVLLSGLDSIGGAFVEALHGGGDAIILVRKAMKVKGAFIGLLESLATDRGKIRVMLPSGTRLSEEDRKFTRGRSIRIRYVEPPILDMMVAGDRDVIVGVPTGAADEPFAAMAVWIRNRDFARSARSSLEETWRRGEEP